MPDPSDRFDDLPARRGRVGAHRAENPRVGGWRLFLVAVAAVVLIVAVGIVWTLVADGRLGSVGGGEPSVQATDVPAVVDPGYAVLILNGTADDARVDEVRGVLIGRGWAEADITTSNASETDVATTVVYYATSEARAAARGLAEVVGASDVVEDPDYPFPGVDERQLTVVLGADASGSP